MGERNVRIASQARQWYWCVMNLRCRCQWLRTRDFCSKCQEKQLHRTCLLSSTFLFFLCSLLLLGGLAKLVAWLTLAPFQHEDRLFGAGCRPDNEGSWAIGFYQGATPFSLRPSELVNLQSDDGSAWPVANPILTCSSIKDPLNPSNFLADPFLYIQVRTFTFAPIAMISQALLPLGFSSGAVSPRSPSSWPSSILAGAKFSRHLSQESDLYVFFETKNSLTLQGDIGVAKSIDGGVTWQFQGIALDEEWHLSYPFVFEHEGQIYMMPEGSKKGDLRLYRATEFPLKWALEKVLINKPLVDSSMIYFNGRWWIFGSDFSRLGVHKNGELEIWHSRSPLGPWKQHMRNPVKDLPRSQGARNAGRLFIWENKLYRPGQDCGGTYGKRIRMFLVEVLTKDRYREAEVPTGIEEPNWNKGRYTWNGYRHHHLDVQRLSSDEWIAVMDGDRVPSGDWMMRMIVAFLASFVLFVLTCVIGISYGFLSRPSVRLPNWSWSRSYHSSPVYKPVTRMHNKNGHAGKRCRGWRTYFGFVSPLISFAVVLVSIFVAVRCFLGGNGAEEPYPVAGKYSQFTMVTMTYDTRIWNLKLFVKHYSRCASVREIVVVWNRGQPPDLLTEFDSAVPIRIRVEPVNSLNNRFKVDPLIKTRSVLELDDDIMMTCDDLERGFAAWRQHPGKLVGFYPRLIDGEPLEYRNGKYAREGHAYNMILTGAAFMDSDLLFPLYSNEEHAAGRAIVDELFNCEDILMNFILANRTAPSQRVIQYVHPSWAVDTSKLSSAAISRDTQAHYNKRTECLQRFRHLFNGIPLQKVEFNSRLDGWDY